jgi:hypothetical protein
VKAEREQQNHKFKDPQDDIRSSHSNPDGSTPPTAKYLCRDSVSRPHLLALISRAGTPPQMECGGTLWVATPMAPSIASSPIFTPAITDE